MIKGCCEGAHRFGPDFRDHLFHRTKDNIHVKPVLFGIFFGQSPVRLNYGDNFQVTCFGSSQNSVNMGVHQADNGKIQGIFLMIL